MRKIWLAPLLAAAQLVVGMLVYSRLPERVPSHWNIAGQVDGYQSRLAAVLLLPAATLGLWLLLLGVAYIDPRRESYSRFRPTQLLFISLMALFFLFLQLVTLGSALGLAISVPRLVSLAGGLLIAGIGNELGRLRPNWFFGIRTPWTLADDEVWRRTHRVAGRLFVVAGIVMALSALFPVEVGGVVTLLAVGGAALGAVAYSYFIWRRPESGDQLRTKN